MVAFDRIAQQPEVMGGRAYIRGTRVTVDMIVGRSGAGQIAEGLLAEYPYLHLDDIREALRYAACWRAEEREVTLAPAYGC